MWSAVAGATDTVVAPTFNLLSTVTWAGAWWASDPGWSAPANAASVTTWNDGSGGSHPMVQPFGFAPIMETTAFAGSKPCVRFNGTSQFMFVDVPWLAPTQTFSMAMVCTFTTAPAAQKRIMGNGNTGLGMGCEATGPKVSMNSGTQLTSTTINADTSPHLWVAVYAGTSSKLLIDGVSAASGSAGTTAATDMAIGSAISASGGTASLYAKIDVAFAAAYAGDLTADSHYTAMKSYLSTFYGFTIT